MNQEKKEKILNAAKREFIENGFAYAKVMSICKRAEIPRSAYYRYFDSLDDSLSAVFENMEKFKIFKFRDLVMNSGLDFISVSIKIFEIMLDDEESYLFMSTLSRSNTFDLPMFRNQRKMDFHNSSKDEIAIRNALMTVIKGFTDEYYTGKKTKEECLEEYTILIDMLKHGAEPVK